MMHRLRQTDLVVRALGEDMVLLDLVSSRYLKLNASAAVVVGQLQQGEATTEELVHAVTSEFDVDTDLATTDVEALLKDMAGRGLLA